MDEVLAKAGLFQGIATEAAEAVAARKRDRDDVGFESQDNEVVLLTHDAERTVAKAPKTEIARQILDEVERLLEERA